MTTKTFHLDANFYFYADDIDDALKKLIEHFEEIRRHEDSDLIISGDVSLKRVRRLQVVLK